MYGFAGKILHVDLTSGARLSIEQPDEAFYRQYWGGSAMGLYYLLKHTPAHADPLGPENTLSFFISGPTGASISGQSRANGHRQEPVQRTRRRCADGRLLARRVEVLPASTGS